MKRAALVIACLLALSACREVKDEQYVELRGHIFVFNYRVATATYLVTYSKLRRTPEGATMQTLFEDPAGGAPIDVRQMVWPKVQTIAVESLALSCVVRDRPYAFKSVLFDADGRSLQEISGTVTSNLDQSILPDGPLVVGPGYEPNPDLNGVADPNLQDEMQVKCKK